MDQCGLHQWLAGERLQQGEAHPLQSVADAICFTVSHGSAGSSLKHFCKDKLIYGTLLRKISLEVGRNLEQNCDGHKGLSIPLPHHIISRQFFSMIVVVVWGAGRERLLGLCSMQLHVTFSLISRNMKGFE